MNRKNNRKNNRYPEGEISALVIELMAVAAYTNSLPDPKNRATKQPSVPIANVATRGCKRSS